HHGAVRRRPAALLGDQQPAVDRSAEAALHASSAASGSGRRHRDGHASAAAFRPGAKGEAASPARQVSDEGDLEETARKLFSGPVSFLKSAPELKFLPDPDVPEIAFAGRSNVG